MPGGGRAFFDKLKCVGICRYVLNIMAATSISRRICYSVRGIVDCRKAKRSGGSENQSRRNLEMARENMSALRRLFSFAVVRQISLVIKEKADNKQFQSSACYRLCVCASGSLITDIIIRCRLIRFSFLHFGQNNGKFSSNVSFRIFTRVLLPQVGHKSHFSFLFTNIASLPP